MFIKIFCLINGVFAIATLIIIVLAIVNSINPFSLLVVAGWINGYKVNQNSPCTKRLPVNFSAPNIGVSSTKLDAELKSLTVSIAGPDEAIGEIDPGIAVHTGLWKTAIEEAFNRMAIFKDDSPRKVSLAVKILKFETPTLTVGRTTHASARYEIIDRSSGNIIFTTDISTSASAAPTPGVIYFAGVDGVHESINRSVQKNIIQFLQALETVDIDKPMFPSNEKNWFKLIA